MNICHNASAQGRDTVWYGVPLRTMAPLPPNPPTPIPPTFKSLGFKVITWGSFCHCSRVRYVRFWVWKVYGEPMKSAIQGGESHHCAWKFPLWLSDLSSKLVSIVLHAWPASVPLLCHAFLCLTRSYRYLIVFGCKCWSFFGTVACALRIQHD